MFRYVLFAAIFLMFLSCGETDPISNYQIYNIELTSPVKASTYSASEQLTVEWISNMPANSVVVFELLHNTTVIKRLTITPTPGKYSFKQALSDVTVSDSTYSVRICSATDNSIIAASGFFSITLTNNNTNKVYEPNDTRNTATPVKISDNQLHSISLSDVDWFAIPVTAADSVELSINTIYGTAFNYYWASELRAGTALKTFNGSTKFTKTISGVNDTLFVCVSKDIPAGVTIVGPKSNEHDYYVTLRDLRDQSLGTLETNLQAKVYNECDTINIVVKNSLTGTLYLYRDNPSYKILVETFQGKAVSYVIPKYTTSGSYYFAFEPTGSTTDLISVVFSINGTSVNDIYEDDNNFNKAKNLLTGSSQLRTMSVNDTDYIKITTVRYRDTRISITTPDSITAYTAIIKPGYIGVDNDLRPTKTATGYSFLVNSASDTIGLMLWRPKNAVIKNIEYTVSAEAVEKQTGIILGTVPLKTTYQFGDTISLKTSHTDDFVNDFSFELYSGNTKIVTICEKDYDLDWPIPYNLAGGEYQIKVKALDCSYPDSTFTTPFTVTSAMVNDISNEPNNDSVHAKVLTSFNIPLDATLLYGDTDWFSFPVDKIHRYSLRVASRDSLSKVDVELDVPGWITNYTSGDKVIYNVAGNVFVKIFAKSATNGGNYTLLVNRFANDSMLIFSKPIAGKEYKAGDTIIHSITNTHLLDDDMKVYLYKGNKKLLDLEEYEQRDTIGEEIIIPEGHMSGNDYYFKVVANEDTAIHSTSPLFTIKGVEADSYEPNNSKDSATLLSASFLEGVSITGTLHTIMYNGSIRVETKKDVDWYGVKLPPNTTKIIQSVGAKFSSSGRDTGFYKAISNTSATEAVINFSISSNSGEYTLTVIDDAEPDNTKETAVSLPATMVNSTDTLYRHFIDEDDIDWYSITLPIGSYSVNTKMINPSLESYDEVNITAYIGDTELGSGTDKVDFVLDAEATVFLEYEPRIFWSDAGVIRYSTVIKTVP